MLYEEDSLFNNSIANLVFPTPGDPVNTFILFSFID